MNTCEETTEFWNLVFIKLDKFRTALMSGVISVGIQMKTGECSTHLRPVSACIHAGRRASTCRAVVL